MAPSTHWDISECLGSASHCTDVTESLAEIQALVLGDRDRGQESKVSQIPLPRKAKVESFYGAPSRRGGLRGLREESVSSVLEDTFSHRTPGQQRLVPSTFDILSCKTNS